MKKFLSMVMALAMTLTLVTVGASAKSFTDDSKITYGEAVSVISSLKVVDGYTDGSFNPTATLTRGAAAKIICNMILGPTTASALGVNAAPFKDVPVSNVFAGYIAYCSQAGIINGYSDGTFKPAATVTGYQFMKMLLGALGYDGSVEGFTGANWTVSVAKLAVSIGLDDGNDNFLGSKAMTREEAALYAFNTLKANVVDYSSKGTTITVNGATIVTGASSAAVRVWNSTYAAGSNAAGETYKYDNVADNTVQFCELYFNKLTLDSSVSSDNFGRPAHAWKNSTTTIGTYADDPIFTTTTSIKGNALYTALGLTSGTTGTALNAGFVNGVSGKNYVGGAVSSTLTTIKMNDTTTVIGGKGIITEVYNTGTTSSPVLKMVQIQPTLGKVTAITTGVKQVSNGAVYTQYTIAPVDGASVSASTVTGKIYTTVVDTSDKNTITITGTIAKNDYVMYYMDDATVISGASVNNVFVTPATVVSGKLTSYSSSTGIYTIAAIGYTQSAAAVTNPTSYTYNTTCSFAVDAYGYVVAPVSVTAANNYVYVLKSAAAYALDGTTLTNTVKSTVATVAGDMSVITVYKTAAVAHGTLLYTDVPVGLYSYTVNTDGTYNLTSVSQATNNSLTYSSPVVATNVYANADTKFVVVNWTSGTVDDNDRTAAGPVYYKLSDTTVTTGYSNIGSLSSVDGAYVDADGNGIAETVFVYTNGSVGATVNYVYYLGTYSTDGTTTTFNVLKDGIATTMSNSDVNLTTSSAAGLYNVNAGTATAIGTTSAAFASFAAKYVSSSTTYTLTNNGGLLYAAASKDDSATSGLTTTSAYVAPISSSVPVYTVSASAKTVTVGSAADLADGVTANQVAITANSAGDAIGAIWLVVD